MDRIFFKILSFFQDCYEEYLFQKSPLAIRLEKFQSQDWLALLSPLEKNNVLSFFSYENKEIHEAIREIKYSRNKKILVSLADFCADMLLSFLEDDINFGSDSKIVFVSVPSHKKSLQEKGFNQAEDLSKEISKKFAIPSQMNKNILKKIKYTKHQTNLSRNERLKNLHQAFIAEIPEEIKVEIDKTFFIVIDDVSTTGSTMRESRRVLRRAGAKHILCFSIARSGE